MLAKIESAMKVIWTTIALLTLTAPVAAQEKIEHFTPGEIRGTLSWDNISAMETGVLKFGGSAGIHIATGIEVGYEQQFIVPRETGSESRSWAYIRFVPFRNWPINPFVLGRAGYYFLPDQDAPALGVGCGLVLFVHKNLAFEASLFTQWVFPPLAESERQIEFDWRVVLYF
jgi:hypothetical protein